MKKNTYEGFTDEKLLKTKNLIKGVSIGFGIIFMLAIAVAIYLITTKGIKEVAIAAFIPIFSMPVVLTPLLANLSMLNKEIKSRNL